MSRRWLSFSLVTALACSLVSVAISPAQAADTLPDGGGRANAGAHDSAQAKSQVSAQATPPAGYTMLGIDVSSHDHSYYPVIDWQGLANSGIKFSYVKATEAQNYVNPYFANDYRDSKAAGILTGAYTYARPDKRDPVGDANYFIDNAGWVNDSRTLVPFLDLEWPWFSGVNSCYNLTQQEMADWIQRFLDQVWLRIGRLAMIYTNPNWWNPCVGSARNFGAYPLDVARYSSTPPTAMPTGWTNWTIWQYAAGVNNQAGNYDKDVFNGDYEALKRLAGVDPPPPLTSKPVVSYHAPTNRLEIFANAGGALVERFWEPKYGWSNWTNLGGNIVGTPSVVYNPQYGSVEVYARTSAGHLVQKYWHNGWSDWSDLGGTIAGDPTAIYDPRVGVIEVYARASNGHLVEKYWYNGWSDWSDLGGDITGTPSVIYDTRVGVIEVYARNSAGKLVENYFYNGWSGWVNLGGDIAGNPSVLYDPRVGVIEVYAHGNNGHLVETYFYNGWSDWVDLGGDVAGDPSVIYNPHNGTIEAYARTGAGHVAETYFYNGWSGWSDLGGNLTDDPAAIYNPISANPNVFVNAGGIAYEKYWGTGGWSDWLNLTH